MGEWYDNDAQRIAYTLLLRLAGPGIADDFAALNAEKARRRAILSARYARKEEAL